MSDDQVIDPPTNPETAVETSVVDQVLDRSSTNSAPVEGNNVESVEMQGDDNMIDSVLNTQVQGNDLSQPGVASVTDEATSVTAQNMQKLI